MPSDHLAAARLDRPPEAFIVGRHPVPIGSIYGIGRNYAAHASELGNTIPESPVVFLKPASCVIGNGGTIELPPQSGDVQHEVEIVLLLGGSGRHVNRRDALNLVDGVGVGIDVTARDLQRKAQAEGKPWTLAKGFYSFGPISSFVPSDNITDLRDLAFTLHVNGQLRQTGNSRDMLFDCAEIIAYLSTVFALQAGDLIFTGTPEGVARIEAGDRLEARLVDYGTSLTVKAIQGQGA